MKMNQLFKSKSIGLFVLGLFALVLAVGAVSAAVLTLTNTTVLPAELDAGESVDIGLDLTYIGSTDDRDFTWEGTPESYWTLPSETVIQPDQTILTTATLTIPSENRQH